MPVINSSNPPPIFPIVPAPAPIPVVAPVPRPMPRPEPEIADEDIGDGEDDMDLGSAEETEAPRKKVDDGISDLFEAPDIDAEMEDLDDLFSVEESDIMGDGDSDLSDLTEVNREDIMGRPPARRKSRPSKRPYPPDSSMGEVRY